MTPGIEIAVQAGGAGAGAAEVAARVERLGFARLLVPDHPGSTGDPFVWLAAAASATGRIGLGTYVLNAGVREPWQIAVAAATLDALSGGRFHLGLGAGHTPAEWVLAGRPPAGARERVDRLHEVTEVVSRLLRGETVTFAGEHVRLYGARIDAPLPAAGRLPLTIGGNGPRVLRLAGRAADIVSVSGLGRTLPDGHTHEVRWSDRQLARSIEHIRAGARDRAAPPRIEALVQHVELTGDRPAAVRPLVELGIPGLDLDAALNTPFVLVGTAAEIADQMRRWHARFGIAGYVMRANAVDAAAAVADAL